MKAKVGTVTSIVYPTELGRLYMLNALYFPVWLLYLILPFMTGMIQYVRELHINEPKYMTREIFNLEDWVLPYTCLVAQLLISIVYFMMAVYSAEEHDLVNFLGNNILLLYLLIMVLVFYLDLVTLFYLVTMMSWCLQSYNAALPGAAVLPGPGVAVAVLPGDNDVVVPTDATLPDGHDAAEYGPVVNAALPGPQDAALPGHQDVDVAVPTESALPEQLGDAVPGDEDPTIVEPYANTLVMGDLVGTYVNGEWISANALLDWFAAGGPWLPFEELYDRAVQSYKQFLDGQRALLTSSTSSSLPEQRGHQGQVRRWGEWRDGKDRWHNDDGSKKNNNNNDVAASSKDPVVTHPTSSSSQSGFYKKGVWQARERTEDERRWAAGGQGKQRQDKRAARMKQWADGAWIPSWLKKFKEEKEERDRLRQQQADGTNKKGDNGSPAKEDDETELWQRPLAYEGKEERDRLRQQQADGTNKKGDNGSPAEEDDETELWQRPLAYSSSDDDVASFMERPGLTSQEYVDLINGGIPAHLARRLEGLLRRYESFQACDHGPEARWALGRWLITSQVGAGAQDRAEEPIQSRSRDARHYPLRREPQCQELRDELLRWTGEITHVMADIYEYAANSAHPGELSELPAPLTVNDVVAPPGSHVGGNSNHGGHVVMLADLQPAASSRPRSRSRSRMHSRDERAQLEDDVSALMDMGDADNGPGENDDTHPATGDEGGRSSHGGAHTAPPPFLGPMSLSGLLSAEDRHYDLMGEEQEFADRAWLVEQAVRSAMYELGSGSAREVVRRLLLRQQHLVEIQFWLDRALQQALKCCPAAETPIQWDVMTRWFNASVLHPKPGSGDVRKFHVESSLQQTAELEVTLIDVNLVCRQPPHLTRDHDLAVHLTCRRELRRMNPLEGPLDLDVTIVFVLDVTFVIILLVLFLKVVLYIVLVSWMRRLMNLKMEEATRLVEWVTLTMGMAWLVEWEKLTPLEIFIMDLDLVNLEMYLVLIMILVDLFVTILKVNYAGEKVIAGPVVDGGEIEGGIGDVALPEDESSSEEIFLLDGVGDETLDRGNAVRDDRDEAAEPRDDPSTPSGIP
ncbi:unnamed protein product [Symbiodinium sp. CCMP2592]|nr:unnamed protein product [Symbiodinium sp. CCMP2592]